MKAQATNRRGARCSTAKAFLRPIRHRPNLHISMNSRVLKVVIDPTTKIAKSVRFDKEGQIYEITATKEIILSAGSVNSPQILMLSGVGRSDHLTSLGIPVLSDLKVGDNLQDHVSLGGMVFTIDKVIKRINIQVDPFHQLVNCLFVCLCVFVFCFLSLTGLSIGATTICHRCLITRLIGRDLSLRWEDAKA